MSKQSDLEDKVEELEKKIENLTNAFVKVTTLTGHANTLKEFGLTRWVPGKKDLGKNYG